MLKLPSSITITRTTNSKSGDSITIHIEDRVSHCEAVEISIGLRDFALALTSMGYVPCEMEFNNSGVIGMKHEHKTEVVFVRDTGFENRERDAVSACKPLEVDGWSARYGDCNNSHRVLTHRDGGRECQVHFSRHVPATSKDIANARKANDAHH